MHRIQLKCLKLIFIFSTAELHGSTELNPSAREEEALRNQGVGCPLSSGGEEKEGKERERDTDRQKPIYSGLEALGFLLLINNPDGRERSSSV